MKISNQFNFFQLSSKRPKPSPTTEQQAPKKPPPPVQSSNKFSLPSMGSQKFQPQQNSTAGSLENGEITEFYFQKLIHIEYQLCLVVFLNMFLIIISTTISFPELKEHDQVTQKGCLYFCLVCVVVQCLLLGFRNVTALQLEKQQKILYEKSTIFSTKKIFYYFAQCLIMLIQPYPFFESLRIVTSNSYDLTEFQLPFNDILTVISVFRIYVFIRAGLILTPYQNTRSNRLCKMYGCKADFSFSLKCMFKDNPLILIGVFFAISSMIFAFQIYLVERRAAYLSESSMGMCNDFLNSLWLILMTITTVGYGDYFPHTAIGRIIILIVAIWGTFIVSMMVVVVSNTLTMEKNQKRTSIIINKLQMRKTIQNEARRLVGYFMLKKKQQKMFKIYQLKLQNNETHPEYKTLLKKKQTSHQKLKKYSNLCNRLQKTFSKLRKQIKNSEDIEDIEDQVSSLFLHVNSDIEILNKNQEKIISFIHEYLEYNGKNKNINDRKNDDVVDWNGGKNNVEDDDDGTQNDEVEEDKQEKKHKQKED